MSDKKEKRVTLQDVAKDAGVSRATASLVVRGSSSITEQTKQKVHASMNKLGYVYDRVAASFRSRRSSTVGIIITDIGNPFFSELLANLQDRLDELGYTTLLGMTFESEAKQERVLETMLEHHVCGIIMAPVAATNPAVFARLKHLNVPCVLIGREISGVQVDYIGTDFKWGTQMAVRHLADQGHKRIALLGGTPHTSAYNERLAGYLEGLEISRIPADYQQVMPGPPTRESGSIIISELVQQGKLPTAAICHNDIVALGVIVGLRENRLVAGKDLALVGFDDIKEAATANPGLTTIAVGSGQWGIEAANLLHERISPEASERAPLEAARIILPPKLVIRESSTHFMGVH
ncbi:LacI family DNA-binding transcriptional regulator [Paenibacillus luteus]|uniref:LacI family DNA-binding transcriptional regulator n=1 Tax=Paenibacillus luteus TaxID=2545753 RepID=UPI0011444317|nr:LacI family DNA-binding transcriptional regulator [Paenibacillus luteus]